MINEDVKSVQNWKVLQHNERIITEKSCVYMKIHY